MEVAKERMRVETLTRIGKHDHKRPQYHPSRDHGKDQSWLSQIVTFDAAV